VVQRLADRGIPASLVGEIVESEKGMNYFEKGKTHSLLHPKVDPFWSAFGKAASEGK
jgi:hydrogenase maturation factor